MFCGCDQGCDPHECFSSGIAFFLLIWLQCSQSISLKLRSCWPGCHLVGEIRQLEGTGVGRISHLPTGIRFQNWTPSMSSFLESRPFFCRSLWAYFTLVIFLLHLQQQWEYISQILTTWIWWNSWGKGPEERKNEQMGSPLRCLEIFHSRDSTYSASSNLLRLAFKHSYQFMVPVASAPGN